MAVVTYLPADIVRWLGTNARQKRRTAVQRALAVPHNAMEKGLVPGLKDAADAAIGLGRQAMGDLSAAQAGETGFMLYDEGFEALGLMSRSKVNYRDVSRIIKKSGDKYWVEHPGGHLTVKPVAHLVAGTHRVAIGWVRNGMEVDYETLIEELCARTGKEVVKE